MSRGFNTLPDIPEQSRNLANFVAFHPGSGCWAAQVGGEALLSLRSPGDMRSQGTYPGSVQIIEHYPSYKSHQF